MEQLLTIGQVAEMFQISRSTAYKLKKQQAWPHILFGTEIRFSAEDVEAIKALNKKTPPPAKVVPNVGTRARRKKQ